MSANIKKAIQKYGTVEFSRWMLNNGQFLGVAGYDDHRIVGEFCTETWLEFVENDCVSLHYDYSSKYLWIRVNGDLNFQQRQSFNSLLENDYINVRTLKVSMYNGRNHEQENDIEIYGYLAKLWLTDRIAYNMSVAYNEE